MRTALILGGGGPIGIAWEAGLLLGLQERDIDLARSDRIVGTSAGAIVGAHLAMLGSVEQLYQAQATPLDTAFKPPNMAPLMAAFTRAKLFHRTMEGQRKSLGRSARTAEVEGEQKWLDTITGFLPYGAAADDAWPERDLLLTAVDAESGELVTWTRNDGVPLTKAVASSCAVPCVFPLVRIRERMYMDGGMGSPTNAMFGEGYDLVVIADPLARMMGKKSPMRVERSRLVKSGSKVVAFAFSDDVVSLIGMNLMDAKQRGRVAEMGYRQGDEAVEVETLRAFFA